MNEAELWAGACPAEYDRLEALFDALACAPAGAAVGKRAGDYLRQFRKSDGLELSDALIAATAVLQGAALWTRNRKHYPMKNCRSSNESPVPRWHLSRSVRSDRAPVSLLRQTYLSKRW